MAVVFGSGIGSGGVGFDFFLTAEKKKRYIYI